MRTVVIPLFLAFLAFGCPGPGAANRGHAQATSNTAAKDERLALPNGLEVVLQPDPSAPLASVVLAIRAGSEQDPPGRSGLAHLVEHVMLGEDTGRISAELRENMFAKMGGAEDGATSPDWTTYYAMGPSRDVEDLVRIQAARVGAAPLSITPAQLERHSAAVLNEIDRSSAADDFLIERKLLLGVFGQRSPYSRESAGIAEEVRGLTPMAVKTFVAAHYAPANAVLIVTGNFDSKAALSAIDLWARPLPASPSPVDTHRAATSASTSSVLRVVTKRSTTVFGWRGPRQYSKDYFALEIGLQLAGRALAQQLGEDATCEMTGLDESSVVHCKLPSTKPPSELENALRHELVGVRDRLLDTAVREAALSNLTHSLRGAQYAANRGVRAARLSSYYKHPRFSRVVEEIHRTATTESIKKAISEWLLSSPPAVVVAAPPSAP